MKGAAGDTGCGQLLPKDCNRDRNSFPCGKEESKLGPPQALFALVLLVGWDFAWQGKLILCWIICPSWCCQHKHCGESSERKTSIQELPRLDQGYVWEVGRRVHPTSGNALFWQVVLGCIRKLAKQEPVYKPASHILLQRPLPVPA